MRRRGKLQATVAPSMEGTIKLGKSQRCHLIVDFIPSFNIECKLITGSPECWAWLGRADSHLLKPVLRLALACMGSSEQKQLLMVLSF